MHRYEVGEVSRTSMVNYFIPGMYLLIVPDGGPESLKWTAAIYNSTKKEIISEYTRFHHGYNQLIIEIFEHSISEGDTLQLYVNNDEGVGQILLNGMVAP